MNMVQNNSFLIAIGKLIEEKLGDSRYEYNPNLECLSILIKNSFINIAGFKIPGFHCFTINTYCIVFNLFRWDFDISNPSFKPEDIIKWIQNPRNGPPNE